MREGNSSPTFETYDQNEVKWASLPGPQSNYQKVEKMRVDSSGSLSILVFVLTVTTYLVEGLRQDIYVIVEKQRLVRQKEFPRD